MFASAWPAVCGVISTTASPAPCAAHTELNWNYAGQRSLPIGRIEPLHGLFHHYTCTDRTRNWNTSRNAWWMNTGTNLVRKWPTTAGSNFKHLLAAESLSPLKVWVCSTTQTCRCLAISFLTCTVNCTGPCDSAREKLETCIQLPGKVLGYTMNA